MKTKIDITKCDCCGEVLRKRNAFYNDGSYQNDYLEKEDLDICFSCVGKIFDKYLKQDYTADVIREHVEKFKSSSKGLTYQYVNQEISFP